MSSNNDITTTLGLGAKSCRFGRWKYHIAIIALMALAAAWLLWNSPEPESDYTFTTEQVQKGNLVVTVTATGQIEPKNQVKVGTETSGTILDVTVDNNDVVTVGMVLAVLDTSKTNTAIQQAEAALRLAQASHLKAQATVTEAKLNYDRQKGAFDISEGSAISMNELDAAKAELQRAKADSDYALAQISQAKASLEDKRLDLKKSIITSPINGVVLERDVDPGQTVAASMSTPTFFTLAEDLKRMELHVDLDEADVGQVREGQNATFTVDAFSNKTFKAVITKVRYASQNQDNVITYETICNVDNDDLLLRPGMTATAEIEVERIQGALLAPNAALRFSPPEKTDDSGGFSFNSIMPRPPRETHKKKTTTAGVGAESTVWILRDGNPVGVPVTIGSTDGIHTQVISDHLSPGDEIILEMVEASK